MSVEVVRFPGFAAIHPNTRMWGTSEKVPVETIAKAAS